MNDLISLEFKDIELEPHMQKLRKGDLHFIDDYSKKLKQFLSSKLIPTIDI